MRGAEFAASCRIARADARLADAAQGHPGGADGAARRSPPPRWCWCGSPTPPICRRPDEALRALGRARRRRPARRARGSGAPARPSRLRAAAALARAAAAAPQPLAREPQPRRRALRRFEDRGRARAAKSATSPLKLALERDVRLVRFEAGRIEFALAPGARRDLPQRRSSARSHDWTGRRWIVALSSEPGAATLHEQAAGARARAPQRRCRPTRSCAGGAGALPRRRDRRRAHARAEAAVEADAAPPADPERRGSRDRHGVAPRRRLDDAA